MLIDEPFIGQDASAVQQIFHILKEFHQEGKTIVIVSHDRKLLKSNCTRILNLDEIKKKQTLRKKLRKKVITKFQELKNIEKDQKKKKKNMIILKREKLSVSSIFFINKTNILHQIIGFTD